MSVPPPGPNGTIMRTGLVGQACADATDAADDATPAASNVATARRTAVLILMRSLLGFLSARAAWDSSRSFQLALVRIQITNRGKPERNSYSEKTRKKA